MRREDCRIGQVISFGRDNGQKTLAKIIKLNYKSAKVVTLEPRGTDRIRPVGKEWGVAYELMQPANKELKDLWDDVIDVQASVVPPVRQLVGNANEKLTYNPFAGIENQILDVILSVYCGLSPENLHCDGEASPAHVREQSRKLHGYLNGLEIALGRKVSEDEIFGWSESRRLAQRQSA